MEGVHGNYFEMDLLNAVKFLAKSSCVLYGMNCRESGLKMKVDMSKQNHTLMRRIGVDGGNGQYASF